MEINLKIPYESRRGFGVDRAPVLKYFIEHRDTQMVYTKSAVESGIYRAWMTQLTDKELESFIKTNKERIERGFGYKTFGPNFHEHYFWRNALYSLELYYRQNNGVMSQDLYDVWIEEVMADKQYYEGKFSVAMSEYNKKRNGVEVQENASFVTPYY